MIKSIYWVVLRLLLSAYLKATGVPPNHWVFVSFPLSPKILNLHQSAVR